MIELSKYSRVVEVVKVEKQGKLKFILDLLTGGVIDSINTLKNSRINYYICENEDGIFLIGEEIEKINLKNLDNFSKYKEGKYTYKKHRIIK